MSFLDRIAECNTWNPDNFRWFVVDDCRLGRVRQALVPRLADFTDVFVIEDDAVILQPRLKTFAARSVAIDGVVRALSEEGIVKGLRNEMYPVTRSYSEPPFLQMERAGVPHFGIRAFGVHMNGYVRRTDGLHMWIGRRAKGKHTYPGMLDNMVAGGQPIGIGLLDNMVKECGEEANIPKDLARRCVPVGAISYCVEAPDGLKPDVQFCFDLELPADFVPRNTDGEIDEFYLWPIAKVAEIVAETQEFKFNCNLVVIDFLVRHGLIPPEHRDYLAICQGLHR
jgi:8-oxo-dGTP pyrophosphatase MutT (NUDIX family)